MCGVFRSFQKWLENCLFLHEEESYLLLQKRAIEWMFFFIWERKDIEMDVMLGNGLIGKQGGIWSRVTGESWFLQALVWCKKWVTWCSCGMKKCGSLSGSDKRPWEDSGGLSRSLCEEVSFYKDLWGLEKMVQCCPVWQQALQSSCLSLTNPWLVLLHGHKKWIPVLFLEGRPRLFSSHLDRFTLDPNNLEADIL